MYVKIIVEVDGRQAATMGEEVEIQASLKLEEQVEQLKDRTGRVLLEVGFQKLSRSLRHPCCCGRRMENRGKRGWTVTSQSGEVTFERTRYRCRHCRSWSTPADGAICCGRHRITRLLGRNICQLATLEHFTRLEQLLADQHGVHLAHDAMLQLVHDVGGAAEEKRLAEAEAWRAQPAETHRCPPADVRPPRVYVSCDGIMYCTNQSEPAPQQEGQKRLIWKQMRVGCVYWQDKRERWHKRVIWGQEEDFLSFAASLYRLACRCGYREAEEKIFAADGGEWCWTIHRTYFADAEGVLDWYHASEHVWACARAIHQEQEDISAWCDEALALLRYQGGEGLLAWLLDQQTTRRGSARASLGALIRYIQPRLEKTDYPLFRARDWQIGTGMIESTARQLVGIRLKGPGMHWSPHGATAITALRAHDINGYWHSFWNTLALAS